MYCKNKKYIHKVAKLYHVCSASEESLFISKTFIITAINSVYWFIQDKGIWEKETILYLYPIFYLGVSCAPCKTKDLSHMGDRNEVKGRRESSCNEGWSLFRGKREAVAAQVVSILEITTLGTWLRTTSLHPNDIFGKPYPDRGI